jgi:hypothetical protein
MRCGWQVARSPRHERDRLSPAAFLELPIVVQTGQEAAAVVWSKAWVRDQGEVRWAPVYREDGWVPWAAWDLSA